MSPTRRLQRRLRHLGEATAFFAFVAFFRALGLDAASAVGGFLGRTIFYHTPLTRRARENLKHAFPEKSDAERERIVRDMWDNLGRVAAEYAHLDKMSILGRAARIVEECGYGGSATPMVTAAAGSGKGVIFFSGHFANWEVMPFIAVQLGLEGGEVYRPPNNPYIDRWLVDQRSRHGPKEQIAKGPRGTRRIFSLLRRGQTICLLADQKTNEGVPATFFGREAMTTPAPAALALKLGSVLVPARLERVRGANFRYRFYSPLVATPTGDHPNDVLQLTQRITDAIEAMVREQPSQWLWIHRRWPTERKQDQLRGKRAIQAREGAGVRVEREGSSLT